MQSFSAKKSLGQNFLKNPKIAETIAQSAGIKPGTIVLEIGPGTGMLTRALLKEGASIVALEADARAIVVLAKEFRDEIERGILTLYHGDARTTDLESLIPKAKKFIVAANIPYYLSGFLFEKLLSGEKQPETLVFLVQKEVAERIARDKKESLLSLSIKVYGNPSYIATVSRGNFSPVPGVDSAILKIEHITRTRLKGLDERHFFRLLRLGYASRRKQLLGNLSVEFPRETVAEVFTKNNIPLNARGEDLTIDTWVTLAHSLCPLLK